MKITLVLIMVVSGTIAATAAAPTASAGGPLDNIVCGTTFGFGVAPASNFTACLIQKIGSDTGQNLHDAGNAIGHCLDVVAYGHGQCP